MKIVTAKKVHGKCDVCEKPIVKNDRYVRFLRHATSEEDRNLSIRTFSPFPGQGRFRELKRHEACNNKEMERKNASSSKGAR